MPNIRNLYAPKCIITSSKNTGYYMQIKPAACLDKFIYCYWACPLNTCSGPSGLQPFRNEPVLPDGCVDIVFSVDREKNEYASKVYGPMDQPFMAYFRYDKFQFFGITFYPGAFQPLFKIPLNELRNKIYETEDALNNSFKNLCREIARAGSVFDMAASSNQYFSAFLNSFSISSPLSEMLNRIYSSRGTVTVKELSQRTIISERQINRIFNQWVGINPKTFSRIVRFQNIINPANYTGAFDWTGLALEYGYYDESHFFNEFKSFYGATPGKYLESI